MTLKQETLSIEGFKLLETRIRSLEHRITSQPSASTLEWTSGLEKTGTDWRKLTALTVLKNHVIDFWNNISLPGFKYVGEPGRHRSDRYVWILVLTLSLIVSSEYIADAYEKWQGSPVLLSFNDSLTPVAMIPFPAVTFCPVRRLSDVCLHEDCFKNNTALLIAAGILCPKSKVLNSTELRERYYDMSLASSIKEVSTPCEEVIEWFKFSKGDVTFVDDNNTVCSQYFQTLYTDGSSVCFTFNMLPAKDMFKHNVIPPGVDKTMAPMKPGWSPDTMLHSADLETTIPQYVNSNRRWMGFLLGLFNFTDDQNGICGETPITSAKMFFHNPAEIPTHQSHEGVIVPLHEDLQLRLNPKIVTASLELKTYTPANRRCFFSDEKQLSLFKVYTQKNCQLECRVNCSLLLCDCVPFYFPRLNSSIKMCGKENWTSCTSFITTGVLEGRLSWYDIIWSFRGKTGDRIQNQFKDYESIDKPGLALTDDILNITDQSCECDCPAECTTVVYDVQIQEGEKLVDALMARNFSRVLVSYKELEVVSVFRKELIGLTDFIANSGGVLGVFTGFSFLALCELVYYLTLRLWGTIKQAWNTDDSPANRFRVGERLRCCFCCGPVLKN